MGEADAVAHFKVTVNVSVSLTMTPSFLRGNGSMRNGTQQNGKRLT